MLENLHKTLANYPLHRGGAGESLIEKLMANPCTDPWRLDLTPAEAKYLAVAMFEPAPTPEEVEEAVAMLLRNRLASKSRLAQHKVRSTNGEDQKWWMRVKVFIDKLREQLG